MGEGWPWEIRGSGVGVRLGFLSMVSILETLGCSRPYQEVPSVSIFNVSLFRCFPIGRHT